MKFNVDYENIVIKVINSYTEKYGKRLTKSDSNKPLTGTDVGLSGNDLFELYLILCKYFSLEIKLQNYYDFYNIKNIAQAIEKSIGNYNEN